MGSHRIVVAVLLCSSGALAAKAKPASKVEKPDAIARELVKGCDEKAISGGFLFQCDRLVATVTEKPETAAELTDGMLALVHALGGDLSMHDVKLVAAGKTLPGVGFEIHGKEKGRENIVGQLLAFETRPGSSRGILCFSSKPSEASDYKCRKIFDALGATGPKPFLAAEPALGEPAFLGRKIGVPDGCKTLEADAGSFRVECGSSASIFYSRARNSNAAKSIIDGFRETFLKTGSAAPDRPCLLGGVAVTCQVVDDGGLTFYLAATSVNGDAVVAICGQEPERVAVHPVCADVFSF